MSLTNARRLNQQTCRQPETRSTNDSSLSSTQTHEYFFTMRRNQQNCRGRHRLGGADASPGRPWQFAASVVLRHLGFKGERVRGLNVFGAGSKGDPRKLKNPELIISQAFWLGHAPCVVEAVPTLSPHQAREPRNYTPPPPPSPPWQPLTAPRAALVCSQGLPQVSMGLSQGLGALGGLMVAWRSTEVGCLDV